MNKKMMKTSIILSIIVFFSILMMLITSVMFYYKRTENVEPIEKINKMDVQINYYEDDIISIQRFVYGVNKEYYFSITNYSKDLINNYDLMFEIISPLNNIIDENFVYILEPVNDNNDNEDNIYINKSETPVPTGNKRIGTLTIAPNSTQEYKLTITLKRNNQKKGIYLNKSFSGKIVLVG